MLEPNLAANSYKIAWFVASLSADGPPRNLGDAGEPRLFGTSVEIDGRRGLGRSLRAKWSPDGQWIAYIRRIKDADQVWRSSLDGSVQEQVTFSQDNVSAFVWSPDGSQIIFATDWSRHDLQSLKETDRRNGVRVTSDTVWHFGQNWPFYNLAPGSFQDASQSKPRVFVAVVGGRSERPATIGEAEQIQTSSREAAGTSIAPPANVWQLRSEKVEANAHYPTELTVEFTDTSGVRREAICSADRCGYSQLEPGLFRGHDSRAVFFWRVQANAPGRTLVHWDLQSGRLRQVYETKDSVGGCASAGATLVCTHQSPTTPRRLITIALRNGEVKTIVNPNEEWRQLRTARTEWITWSDEQGNPTYGVLAYPTDYVPGRRYPLILSGYGTFDAVIGGGRRYPTHVLANQGFFVLVYSHWRAQWPTQPTAAMWKSMYGNDVEVARVPYNQLVSVVRRLETKGLVDRERIGIGGHSNGMNIAAYGLIHSNLFRAAALGWVRWNPSSYYQVMSSSARSSDRVTGLGVPEEARSGSAMEKLSLSLNAACVRAPILVHASDYEFGQNLQMEALVRFNDAKRPLEMFVFPDEQHNPYYPAHRLAEFRRNTQWFMYWLQNKEVTDPVDLGQYARWKDYKNLLAEEAGSAGPGICPAAGSPVR